MESRLVFVSFCLCLLSISLSSALDVGDTVYFCGKTHGGQLYHIPKTVDCPQVIKDTGHRLSAAFHPLEELICQNAQNRLDMLHMEAKTRTTSVMRFLLKTDSIVARFVGDAILVSSCMPLTIRKIYEDHKIGDECYEWTPLEAAEESGGKSDVYFLHPSRREIGLKSPKIKCGTVHPRVYFDGKIWRTAEGPVHVLVDPRAEVMNDLLNEEEGDKAVGYVEEKHSVVEDGAYLDSVVGVTVFALFGFGFIAYKIFGRLRARGGTSSIDQEASK